MKKKVLFIASVSGFLENFEIENIINWINLDYEVYVAANYTGNIVGVKKGDLKLNKIKIKKIKLNLTRNPLSVDNFKSFKILYELDKKLKFDIIDCHTPIGGILGRTLKIFNSQKYLIYTAHGFHFYKKGPIKNWLLYYPIEYLMSFFTDTLITINNEDYKLAKDKFKATQNIKIPGVGLNVSKISDLKVDKVVERSKLGIKNDQIVLVSVGELSSRKNHEIVIKALGEIQDLKLIYLIAGEGKDKNKYLDLIKKYKLEKNIFLLGHREDIIRLCKISDIFIHPSRREGLGMAALEGMAAGLPLIASDINGIKDYAKNNITGINIDPLDKKGFKTAIIELSKNKELREKYSLNNLKKVKEYDISATQKIMKRLYKEINKKINY